MLKKPVFVTILLILVLSCTFASGKFNVEGQVSPFALQSVNHTSGKYNSTYGFGFEVGGRYEVIDSVRVGLDLGMDWFKYNELAKSYMVIKARAVGGYTYTINHKFSVTGEVGVGMDLRGISGAKKAYFAFGADVKAGYVLNDSFILTGGVGMDLTFQKGKTTNSTDFIFRTTLGVVYAL